MPSAPPPRRRRAPAFQPRFTLTLLYLFLFFFVYCMLFALPPLIEAYRSLPDTPRQEDLELAAQVAQRAVQPRLWLALAAALVTTAAAAYTGWLPGLRH